jgi:peptidoglycan/xylan/chitin deacetylase (PgdA/CDA1 family)
MLIENDKNHFFEPKKMVSILMYHQIGAFAPMKTHRANYCDQRRFAAQMGFLARFGYSVLSLEQALSGLRGERRIPPRAVVLTFDDAYDNFAEYALPILERHAFPATVYAISGWLGRRADWFAKDPGRPLPTLMSGERLRAVHAAGISVGSHTVSHLKLAELDPRTRRTELSRSKAALEDVLGEPVEHLCYPFGSFDLDTIRAAAETGYRSATTCLRGAAHSTDHPLVLPRKAISYGDNLLGYWWKLAVKQAPKPALLEWRTRLMDDQSAFGDP